MKTIEKLIAVVTKNMAYAIVLLISIALFAIFSDGFVSGLITAASAFIAFVSAALLYKEFKKESKSEHSATSESKPVVKSASKPSQKKKK